MGNWGNLTILRAHCLKQPNLLFQLLVLVEICFLVPLEIFQNSGKVIQLPVELLLFIAHVLHFLLVVSWTVIPLRQCSDWATATKGVKLTILVLVCTHVLLVLIRASIVMYYHLQLFYSLLVLGTCGSVLLWFIFVLVELVFKVVDQLPQEGAAKPFHVLAMNLLIQHGHHLGNHLRPKERDSVPHFEILTFKVLNLLLEMMWLLLNGDLLILNSTLVLTKQPLGFIMNKIAKYLKTVSLFNRLLLEQFCHHRYSLPQITLSAHFLLQLVLYFLHTAIGLLLHGFELLDLHEEWSALIDELVVAVLQLLTARVPLP